MVLLSMTSNSGCVGMYPWCWRSLGCSWKDFDQFGGGGGFVVCLDRTSSAHCESSWLCFSLCYFHEHKACGASLPEREPLILRSVCRGVTWCSDVVRPL